MAFVDSPHYAWVMAYLWGMKNFFVSLGTVEVLTPSHRPTIQDPHEEVWEPVFNGLNGPYMLLGLTYDSRPSPKYYYGNDLRIFCDDEMVYKFPLGGLGSNVHDEDLTRYVGRDGEWAPFFFAQESMLVETRPQWAGFSSGTINCTIMRFAE